MKTFLIATLLASAAIAPSAGRADQFIHDDVYIAGELCAGNYCTPSYPAPYGTLMLRDRYTRILFDDVSTSNTESRNDWRIEVNNQSADYFALRDVTANTAPFYLEPGADSNSLRIAANRRIGIGTFAPQTSVHVATGGTASMRLERDTSQGGSNPRAWDIQNNLSGLHIRDVTGATSPFTVRAGTPSYTVSLDDNGYVGFGTIAPEQNLHVEDAFNPTLRLEALPSRAGGRVWDVRATENHFGISDQGGPTEPFAIYRGAPNQSMFIASDGDVGLGTNNPQAALHVMGEDGTGAVLIEETSAGTLGQLTLRNNGITYFTLEDTSIADVDYSGRKWNFQNQGGTFRVTTAPGGPGEIEMQMDTAGNMFIKGQLFTGTGGATTECAAGCDAVFDDDYTLPSIDEHQASIRANRHLPAVGPTDESGPFNLSQMSTGMLNELEKAHLYIGQLHGRIGALEEKAARTKALEARLAQVEALLSGRLAAD